jgi:hypothetical protein
MEKRQATNLKILGSNPNKVSKKFLIKFEFIYFYIHLAKIELIHKKYYNTMSTVAVKRRAIEVASSQIQTGAEADAVVNGAVKSASAGKIVSAVPATTYAYTHEDQDEVLLLSGLTGATTINLTAGSDLQVGASLTIEVTQGGTGRNLVFGTGITADALTGVANDVDVVILKYTAVDTWKLISNVKSVNAA